ncbi:MAG: porin [Pirellulaceae bacterium]
MIGLVRCRCLMWMLAVPLACQSIATAQTSDLFSGTLQEPESLHPLFLGRANPIAFGADQASESIAAVNWVQEAKDVTPADDGPTMDIPDNLAGDPKRTTVDDVDDEADDESDEKDDDDDGEDAKDKLIEDLTKRLDAVEESWEKYQGKLEKEASDKAKKSYWTMTGRLHMDYWNFLQDSPGIGYFENPDPTEVDDFGQDPEDRFLFRRLRLEFQGAVPQNMLFRIQIDFNNPQTPEYKDAYIGWSNLPYNQVLLLGNQKRPMGLDHLNSSRFNVFAERPLAVEAFNEDARRIGLTMYGHNDPESVFWAYGLYNLENTSTTGRFIGDSMQLGGYGRLGGSPWYDEVSGGRGYWHMAVSGALARPDGDVNPGDDNDNEARFRTRPLARSDTRWLDTQRIAGAEWFETIGLESMLNIGSLQITSEYFFNWVQRDNVTLNTGPDVHFHGGYIFASYFLTGEHIPYKRSAGVIDRVKPFENFFLVDRWCRRNGGKRGLGAIAVALRYDYLDLTSEDIQGGVGNAITAGLNWHWTAYSKLQTNLIFGEIDDHRPVGPAGNQFVSGDFTILGMRFMLDF